MKFAYILKLILDDIREEKAPTEAQLVQEWLHSHHHQLQQADNLSKFHGLDLHTNSNCLACFRLASNGSASNQDRRRSGSLSLTAPNAGDNSDLESRASASGHCSPLALKRLRKESLLTSDDSFGGSTQSLRSDAETKGQFGESILGKIMQRREVIKLISSMNSPVGIKTVEQNLLK